jgi:drug/metabolite transporter (DMT)-like permease
LGVLASTARLRVMGDITMRFLSCKVPRVSGSNSMGILAGRRKLPLRHIRLGKVNYHYYKPVLQSLKTHSVRADLLMLLAALIWGGSFVAQRFSLATMGPFAFTGVRFLLGAVVVAGLSHWLSPPAVPSARNTRARALASLPWAPGALLGVLVAVSISAQQIGLRYTKVANAGFISSMYVVIVPLLSLLLGQRLRLGLILGALCAATGLYYLSGEHLTLAYGDAIELFGAAVISVQVMLYAPFTRKHDPLQLALIQNLVCAVVCLLVGAVLETTSLADLRNSALTLLYCGALSVGVGYAIQAVAQRDALPSHAALIFSMEGVFSALAAWIIIGETLSWHALGGCALVVLGCMLSQLMPGRRPTPS